MRLFGLTLALLASSLGARAESVEDRMTALEEQVKTLQEALRSQNSMADKPELLSMTDGQTGSDKTALINSK